MAVKQPIPSSLMVRLEYVSGPVAMLEDQFLVLRILNAGAEPGAARPVFYWNRSTGDRMKSGENAIVWDYGWMPLDPWRTTIDLLCKADDQGNYWVAIEATSEALLPSLLCVDPLYDEEGPYPDLGGAVLDAYRPRDFAVLKPKAVRPQIRFKAA